MAKMCNSTTMISCSMALVPAPVPLTATPGMVQGVMQAAATVMDFAPMTNIPTFGMCNSPSDPAVIAATAAALGVHTPAPCIPKTTSPWSPGSTTVTIGGLAALMDSDTCNCTSGGSITVKESMAPTVEIGS
jgi:uncharacterized protein DUF4280